MELAVVQARNNHHFNNPIICHHSLTQKHTDFFLQHSKMHLKMSCLRSFSWAHHSQYHGKLFVVVIAINGHNSSPFLHRLRKMNVETPIVMLMSLLEGHVSASEGPSTELAVVTTERWYMAPGVQRIEIRQNGVVGTLFLPPGELKNRSVHKF